MKRLAILFSAVLLILSALLITSVSVAATQEQLTHEETVLYGDPAAADGLQVSLRYTYRAYLQWFTDYAYQTYDNSETAFRCYTVAPNFAQSSFDYRGVVINTVGSYLGMDHLSDLFRMEAANGNTKNSPGLLGAYQKLYHDTQGGELTNTYLRIADHCEYYPLAGTMELPADGYHWNYYSDSGYLVKGKETAEAFNSYFRIPVLEDDWIQVVVDKRSGNVMEAVDVTYPRKGSDWYEMDSVGICHKNTAYFTFDPLTAQGNVVDTSLIPGGYGLYSIAFDDKGNPDLSTLSTRLSLDPTYEPSDMKVDEEFENLHYFSTKDGSIYLTVIALDTMEVLQQIRILDWQENTWQYYKQQGNYIVAVATDRQLTLWQKNDRGLYEYCFSAELRDENSRYGLYDAEFAFDGERLAVVNWLDREYTVEDETVSVHRLCGYSLSVYTKDGCAYQGLYTSSLEPKDNIWLDTRCWLEQIAVTWKSQHFSQQ